jgi:hypothetical protein
MKVSNAISKLQRAGFEVTESVTNNRVTAVKGREVIQFWKQDDKAIGIKARRIDDEDDSMRDYSAGVFVDSITRAIAIAR